jgi:hypothetical protein
MDAGVVGDMKASKSSDEDVAIILESVRRRADGF